MSQSKDWCFTDFADFEEAIPIYKRMDKANYVVFQEEKCPDTGRLHLQGFIQMKKRVRLTGMKKLFGDKVHFERRRGTVQEAIDYCKKSESSTGRVFEEGKVVSQGFRSDLLHLKEMIENGATTRELAETHFTTWQGCHRALDKYKLLVQPARDWKTEVHVRYGDAGTGKSRGVYEIEGRDRNHLYVKTAGGKWFDAYDGQPVMLMDDFTGEKMMPLELFLLLTDRNECKVEWKGSFTQFLCRKIYITSNLSPEEWYPTATPEQHRAIRRRLTTVTKFSRGLETNGN